MISVKMLRVFLIWSAITTTCFRSNSQVPALDCRLTDGRSTQYPKLVAMSCSVPTIHNGSGGVLSLTLEKRKFRSRDNPHGRPSRAELPPNVKLQAGMVGNLSTMRVRNGWILGLTVGSSVVDCGFLPLTAKPNSSQRRMVMGS